MKSAPHLLSRPRLTSQRILLLALIGGFCIRIGLARWGSFQYDAGLMRFWAARLVSEPLSEFYNTTQVVDHLPGDLWIIWLVAHIYHLFSPEMDVYGFRFLIILKLIPAIFDVGIGGVLYLIGRRLAGPRLGSVAAAYYMLNPASIYLTAIWGQWDSVSGFFAITALWLFIRGNYEWSLPMLTYSMLIKPQFAVLIPLFAISFVSVHLSIRPPAIVIRRTDASTTPRFYMRIISSIIISLLIVIAAIYPFNVGIPPITMQWSIFDRLNYALNTFNFTTLNAFNFWSLWTTPQTGMFIPDSDTFLLGVSSRIWGGALFIGGYVLMVCLYWRRMNERMLILSCVASTLLLFMLPTRVHERYLFPAVMFAALAAGIVPRLRPMYAILSVNYLVNLYYVLELTYPLIPINSLYSSDLVIHMVALANAGILCYALIRAPRAVRDG